jgi:hypothetical protein
MAGFNIKFESVNLIGPEPSREHFDHLPGQVIEMLHRLPRSRFFFIFLVPP